MAIEKQERLLRQLPPIVVATPGRLWKLMSEVLVITSLLSSRYDVMMMQCSRCCQGDSHLCSLDHLRFLVLDEADRMVEYGHYQVSTVASDFVCSGHPFRMDVHCIQNQPPTQCLVQSL